MHRVRSDAQRVHHTFGEVKVQHCQYNHAALHCAYSSMSKNVPELVGQSSSLVGQHIAAQTEMPCTPATNVAMSANSTIVNRYNLYTVTLLKTSLSCS